MEREVKNYQQKSTKEIPHVTKKEAWRIRRVACVSKKRLCVKVCDSCANVHNGNSQHTPAAPTEKPERMLCPNTTNQRTLSHPNPNDSVIPKKSTAVIPIGNLAKQKHPRNLRISSGSFQTTTRSMLVFWGVVPFGEICSCYILLLGLGASQVVYS